MLDEIAEALLAGSLVATAETSQDQPFSLRVRMFEGLHVEISVTQGVDLFMRRIRERDFISDSLARLPGMRLVVVVLKNFLKSVDLPAASHGLSSARLYRLAMIFSEQIAPGPFVHLSCHAGLLICFLEFLTSLPSQCNTEIRALNFSVSSAASGPSCSTDGRPSWSEATAASIMDGVDTTQLIPALKDLLCKLQEAATESPKCHRRLLEKLIGDITKEVLFCSHLRLTGRMPRCMNPADRFTPDLRAAFKTAFIPKHLGKSIYWMGVARIDSKLGGWLRVNARKLKQQLEWFPRNNSQFFVHEPTNELCIAAAAALNCWLDTMDVVGASCDIPPHETQPQMA